MIADIQTDIEAYAYYQSKLKSGLYAGSSEIRIPYMTFWVAYTQKGKNNKSHFLEPSIDQRIQV